MTVLLARIERDVERLSREERERLLSDLAAGMDSAPLSEVDQAWVDEAERRFDELMSGRVKGIPAQEAFDGVRRELGWKR